MPSFDFITDRFFRQSLENDYQEMLKGVESMAWKSAQVIAGSVVEALLIDYLASVPNSARTSKSPLSMDLAEAISVCRAEKALTDRTADLCSVIRSYRNLIHPGRVVRLDEPEPGRESASIALSLVEIISEELAKTRRKQLGLTAEQLLSKLERDQDSLTIFKHIVLEASEFQRERLLLDLLPEAHERLHGPEEWHDVEAADRVESAFETTFSTVSGMVKKKVVAEFVRVVREKDGAYVVRFTDAFFRAQMIEHVVADQRPMVLAYVFRRVETSPSIKTLRLIEGITPFLGKSEGGKWTDVLVRAASNSDAKLRSAARQHLSVGLLGTTGEFDRVVWDRLDSWKNHYQKAGQDEKVEMIHAIEGDMVPF